MAVVNAQESRQRILPVFTGNIFFNSIQVTLDIGFFFCGVV